jgi:hypothetical protein
LKIAIGVAGISVWLLCATATLVAHHAFKSEFDPDKPIHLAGKITEVDWGNPHVYFSLAVPDNKGGTVDWRVELVSPNALTSLGMTRLTLRMGIDVMVDGFAAKSGDRTVGAMAFDLKDTGKHFDMSESWKRFDVPVR